MRSLEESRKRWDFTIKHAVSLDGLRKSLKKDGDESPCVTGLRSVCWKAFLLFQSTEVTGWSRALIDSRSAYASLREHFLRYIENPDELGSALDPLDDDQNSPWHTLRKDEEIRAEIFQDVERCMPEEPYFRSPETQRMLLDILFIFCKINQDVGYRQGMHEVLAPILWVVEQDAIENAPQKDQNSVMEQILDATYIEHDAFTLLSLIMRSAKSFYELAEPDRRVSTPLGGGKSPEQGASPIVERSKRIHEVYLARLDPELAKHLSDIEVLPQIFLIRWIRLLFGREFPFDELLALWDTLFAEDPGLELIDMVCVAMLLRIRWQFIKVIESNYSFALMLLLKYPSPEAPNGPKSFADDATYLRDNFSAIGGANIISKYSGKTPPMNSSSLRPSTPLGQALSPKRSTRSPLPSPARFLQQQGGVEALFQGAAKGVFDRGERLGINQAVRDAVGEVKKNMQGLQASRSNSGRRAPSDANRWSLDEGKSIPSPRVTIAAINARNQQLAVMLGQAMIDLRAVSVSPDGNTDKYVKAIDLAIAKVEFVKVYLEDSTIPLPEDASHPTQSPPLPTTTPQPPPPDPLQVTTPKPPGSPSSNPAAQNTTVVADTPLQPSPIPDQSSKPEPPQIDLPEEVLKDITQPVEGGLAIRPKAPVPTRSSIAQSSFSWMLEPDVSLGSTHKSSPPKSGSPFLKSSRRPTSGPNREKAAFLFGEDGGESNMSVGRLPLGNVEEGFNLGTIKGHNTE
ncbi:RabGAP/TBC [Mollisia scopiformis]|uniref:RabGAP/TBC n=1 Tax=Mollisia scopiformis TaxID=149040 RepID=A0A194XLJ2_MOLSC|nr:RabGAP/TBC [Mollisia scopiformis]KUJ21048.1 RabGAP/TBC [Mollisia scopiformis]